MSTHIEASKSSGGIKSSEGISRAKEGPDNLPKRPKSKPAPPAATTSSDLAFEVARLKRQIANIRIIRNSPADHVDVTDTGITIKLRA